MKRHIKLFGATLLSVGWTGLLFAGSAFYGFDQYPPSTDPALSSALIFGTHNSLNAGLGGTNSQIWCSGAPLPQDGTGHGTNGFPKTGGYLSISDATNGNNNLVFVFPDIDNGLPIQGFQIDMDMRVGNGSLGRPADGFSISFARAGDVALVNATNLTVGGFAGGDGSVAAASSPAGSTDVENGTKTGVAVVFDAWQGNYLPDTPPINGPGTSTDREGIAVRVDDSTYVQLNLVNNRNERDCTNLISTGLSAGFVGSATQTNTANPGPNGLGGLSMQTGTNAFFASNNGTCTATYGNTDTSGSFTNLYWEHLLVRLTNISSTSIPTNNLTVLWKGVQVVNTNLAAFSPTVGRLVLAGRCGGNMQHCHVDNLKLVTVPTTNTYIVKVLANLGDFSFELSDNGTLTVTNILQVKLDATDVTAQTLPSVSYVAPITSGGYTNPVFFASLSAHVVTLVWEDNLGNTNIGAIQFTTPAYSQFPAQFALPASAIDTTKGGMLLTAYQTTWNNPNVIAWTDEMFEGLHGTNIVNNATVGNPVVNGFQVWNNVMGFFNYGAKGANQAAANQGLYYAGSSLGLINGVATGDADLTAVGIGLGTYPQDYRHDFYDNVALEMFGYIYFPTSGVYNMAFANDDQFQITTSQSPYDRMGTIIEASPGVRVPSATTLPVKGFDIRNWFVSQPGYYPIRVVWENGGGGCSFEWYTYSLPGPNTPGFGTFLVNDVANANSANGVVLLLYYGLNGSVDTGPYISGAIPARNPPPSGQAYSDMYFYSPIVVDLNDGTTVNGNGKTINDTSITLTVDSLPVAVTHTRNGSGVHVVQNGPVNWSTWPNSATNSIHTNLLSFTDVNGSNYVYNWTWQLIGGISGQAGLDGTNLVNTAANNNVMTIPSSLQQVASVVNTSLPGARVRVWQTPMEAGQSHSGWSEGELQGEKGFNVADLSQQAPGGYWVWTNLFDFRYDSGGGSGAEWNFDLENSNPNVPDMFGTGPNAANPVLSPLSPPGLSPNYRFIYSGVNTKPESSVYEFSGWIIFPASGQYLMNFNSDDGVRLMFPQGSPVGKLNPATVPYITNIVMEANVGRGVAGQSGGIYNGGTWAFVNVPVGGAYPFRLLWYNGGTGAGFEWSVVQPLPDGRVARIPVNDPSIPGSLKVYQTLNTGDSFGPYVSHVDPVYDEPDAIFNEPTVVDIADGPSGKTINLANANVQLWSDGVAQNVTVTQPSPGTTHIAQQMTSGFFWVNGNHTNILTYKDTSGNVYSNVWWFVARVPNNNIVWIPSSQRVDTSLVDHSQPGFRVKSYQTVNGIGSVNQTEQAFQGVLGSSITTVNPPSGYFVWTNQVDFADNWNPSTASHGEYRYNYSFSNTFGITLNGGGANENNCALMWAGWFEFPQAGMYTMTVNSDDGFRISTPYGMNPFNSQGLMLGWTDAGRGDSGGSANPFNGSSTPVFFNIPQAGAYPIRLIWWNGGGGLALEWTMFQPTPEGSVERALIGDWASYPNQVKVYQTLLTNPPSVISSAVNSTSTNAPGNVFGAQPQALLGSPLGFGAQTSSQSPLGAAQDFWVTLQDGTVGVNPSTVTLSLNGVVQPITVVTNPAGAGMNNVYRFGTNGLWPSGAWAPLMISYQDNNGNSYTYPVEWVMTPFWGTLHHGYPANWGDPKSQGFKVRTVQNDPGYTDDGVLVGAATTGPQVSAQRVHAEEQILTGLWGPNFANLAPTNYTGGPNYGGFNDFGYFDVKGAGPTNGVINLNAQYPAQAGNFQYPATLNFNQPIPGLQGTGPSTVNAARNDSVAMEVLAYVAFPTNGTYTLGVSSDDGFRVMQQWTAPTNNGVLIINSPAGIAGPEPALMNVTEGTAQPSCPITNMITGNLVLATGNLGASTNGEGCVIANAGSMAGNIALMYQSKNGVCGVGQQVLNAVAAGAKAVVLITKHTPLTDGAQFPDEQTVNPMQPIPLVSISENDGKEIVAAMATNTVNVTLTPQDYQFNPPDDRVLGQTSVGKGNSDCNFSVVVTNAPGLYPLRLTWINGGGGVNLDWYSLTGNPTNNGGRVLINDMSTTNGIALQAFYNLMPPSVTVSANNLVVNYVGTLLTSNDPTAPINTWTTVATPSPVTIPINSAQPQQYFRSVYAQRP